MSHVSRVVADARQSQPGWEALSIADRLHPVRDLRRSLATDPIGWADAIDPPQGRLRAESLAAEVGPLADACRWLQSNAAQTLRSRQQGRGLGTVSLRVERKPLGVVLVIGAGNYPLFLLAAPAIQALAAGNAVLLKPPPGGESVAAKLHETITMSAGSTAPCYLLGGTPEAAIHALDVGIDHVVLTGSAATGSAVAAQAAESLAGCTLECSGSDAAIILQGAPLDRAAACIAWGSTFNSGSTCIAPRRIVGGASAIAELGTRLAERFADAKPRRVSQRSADEVLRLVGDAIDHGIEVLSPRTFGRAELEAACGECLLPPILLSPSAARPALLDADLFAPVVMLLVAETVEEQVAVANDSPFALGASVFGPEGEASRVARRLRAGCVTINDLVAPTGDARAPFGGAGQSGHGVTRGPEGLLAMTRPQAILRRHGAWLPHLDEPTEALDELLAGMIQSQHADGLAARWLGLLRLAKSARKHRGGGKE